MLFDAFIAKISINLIISINHSYDGCCDRNRSKLKYRTLGGFRGKMDFFQGYHKIMSVS